MRSLTTTLLLATALAGCNTVRGVGADVASVGDAFDPNRTYTACGTYAVSYTHLTLPTKRIV